MALEFTATYKILVLGDSNVGKTCMVHRFCDERYYDTYISTIGKCFVLRSYEPPVAIHALYINQSSCGRSGILPYLLESFKYYFFLGIDFKQKIINLDGVPVKLQIWDTAGQERFRTLTTAYYRGAMGILLMYDVTNLESYNHITYWLKNIEEVTQKILKKIFVVGKEFFFFRMLPLM